jgi:hypothetical protein
MLSVNKSKETFHWDYQTILILCLILAQNFGSHQFAFNRERPLSDIDVVKREVDPKHCEIMDDDVDFDDDDIVSDEVTTSAMTNNATNRHDVGNKSDVYDDLEDRGDNDGLGQDSGIFLLALFVIVMFLLQT